jgi:hypothetical protein
MSEHAPVEPTFAELRAELGIESGPGSLQNVCRAIVAGRSTLYRDFIMRRVSWLSERREEAVAAGRNPKLVRFPGRTTRVGAALEWHRPVTLKIDMGEMAEAAQ